MAPLEPDLSRALRRRPAPPRLEERILSRLPRESRPVRPRLTWSLAAAAALLVGLLGFYVNEWRVERRNERAREQLVETLAFASRHIARAESKAFSGEAWRRMQERLEQIEISARSGATPMHSPAPRPRI
jgi:hypothetical protein